MTSARRFLRRPAVILILLALVFAGPPVAAWIVYANLDHWRPGTTNHGELIAPPRPLEGFTLQRVDGTALDAAYLRGKWTLVYIGPADCAEACRRAIYYMRQVRLALGQDADRVQRLFVPADPAQAAALRDFLEDYPGMTVASGTEAELQEFLGRFIAAIGPRRAAPGRVYIVDPLGNLMMTYPPDAAPKGMLKDLQRLLRVSQVG